MMLAGFGAISLSIIFFFVLYRFQGIGAGLKKVADILNPFIYGSIIAYLLRPVCNWYDDTLTDILPEKMRKSANVMAVALSMFTGFLVVYLLLSMILPELVTSIQNIWVTMPDRVQSFLDWATVTFGENEQLLQMVQSAYNSLYTSIDQWATNTLVPYVTNIVSGVGQSVLAVLNFLLDFLIGIIVAVYLLLSRKKFAKQGVMVVRSTLKPKWADMFLAEIAFIDRVFGGFIDGKLVDSAIIGVLCYIGCLIFKFPNPLLIAAIVGITNIIPFFGPFIGAIPSTFLILIEDPIKALWFVLFVLVLQQLDGNIIGPKILGDSTGLASFWVLFSIIVSGGLFGFVGMVVGVPIFAVFYTYVTRFVNGRLKKKGLETDTAIYEEFTKYEIDKEDIFGKERCNPGSCEPVEGE
jgi:predicted PurR-regulated permease PerM